MAKKGKTCAEFQNDSILLFYDELAPAEKKTLHAHLLECSACRQEQEKWSTIFRNAAAAPLDKDWLRQNRQALFFRLRGRAFPAIKRRKPAVAWALQLGFATVLLVFSFMLGRAERPSHGSVNALNDLLTAGREVTTETGSMSPILLGIEKITAKPDGAVEIRYQTMNDMRIQGRPSDPEVQHILRYAMLNDDAGVRLHAVKATQLLGETPEQVEQTTVDALETILENEANVGIRLAVIKTFAAFSSTPRIQEMLFKTMLHDSSEAVRIQAFKSLTEHEASGELEKYLNTVQSDSNVYIRLKSLDMLKRKEAL